MNNKIPKWRRLYEQYSEGIYSLAIAGLALGSTISLFSTLGVLKGSLWGLSGGAVVALSIYSFAHTMSEIHSLRLTKKKKKKKKKKKI